MQNFLDKNGRGLGHVTYF